MEVRDPRSGAEKTCFQLRSHGTRLSSRLVAPLSPEEAADQVGISTGNLAVRATRARQRIRKQLIEWGVLSAAEGDAP